tara:strand:+ start:358 stop:978 length:621 start_codon:yes stop_codon:yes gene_type:complete
MEKKIRPENLITESDAKLLVELQKTYYNLNSVHDHIPNKFDNGAISSAMNSCSNTIYEILSKYVYIAEFDLYLGASKISEYIWNNSLDCYPDADAFQELVLNLIWNEMKCIDHNEIILFEDATTDYNNSIISLSDAYRSIKNGEDLIVMNTGLEKRIKEMYYTDDISDLRVVIEFDKFSANASYVGINRYWWLAEELSHYNVGRNW